MSASTVSITANTTAAARRRPVVAGERRSNLDFLPNEAQPNGAVGKTAGTPTRDLIRGEAIVERSPSDLAQAVKKAVSAATGNNNATAPQRRTRKVAVKPEKPRWKRVVSIFTKNFVALLLLVGLVQVVRMMVMKSAESSSPAVETQMGFSELEGRIAVVDGFLKTTAKMMQVQVELLDRKIDGEARGLRQKIDDTATTLQTQLKKIDSRNDRLEKSLDELNAQNWVSKEELKRIYEELKKRDEDRSGGSDVNVDELRAYARDIVEKEIEKHAADGLGRVDYALASGGAFAVKHSEPYLVGKGGTLFAMNSRSRVHKNAVKMLTPSFGEPGQCFPLKGSNGFVQIRLRAAVIPEAVTLEHVAKSVAYDRSSAPKDCRVSGWLQGQDIDTTFESERMLLMTEFTYDLDKTNAQTFDVIDSARSGLVDTIRFDFTSNHGSPSHTCIYRLRIHGSEPDSVSVVPTNA